MSKIILFCILFLAPASLSLGLDATSIQPSTTSPGEIVVLTGGPFTSRTRVMVGNNELLPDAQESGRLSVRIPAELTTGDYVIFLIEGEITSRQAFILHLVERRPDIATIEPAEIDACQVPGSQIQINGQGFAVGSKALVDGVAVASERNSTTTLTVSLPPLAGGNHQIQVVNPSGGLSIPQNLVVSDLPLIDGIGTGEDQVNSYQLVISGKNFVPHSQLLVDSKPISRRDRYLPPNNDIVEYIDCNTLHYTRFQVSGQLQRVKFKVLNPSGRQSEPYEATIR